MCLLCGLIYRYLSVVVAVWRVITNAEWVSRSAWALYRTLSGIWQYWMYMTRQGWRSRHLSLQWEPLEESPWRSRQLSLKWEPEADSSSAPTPPVLGIGSSGGSWESEPDEVDMYDAQEFERRHAMASTRRQFETGQRILWQMMTSRSQPAMAAGTPPQGCGLGGEGSGPAVTRRLFETPTRSQGQDPELDGEGSARLPIKGWSPSSAQKAIWDMVVRPGQQAAAAATPPQGCGLGGGASSSAGPAGPVGYNPYAFPPMRLSTPSYSGGGTGSAAETPPWTASEGRPVIANPVGPQVIDPRQDVRVTAHGFCYHVVSGTCPYCPRDRSEVITLQMAWHHLQLRPCVACNVADYVSQNMVPAGRINDYDVDGTWTPQ